MLSVRHLLPALLAGLVLAAAAPAQVRVIQRKPVRGGAGTDDPAKSPAQAELDKKALDAAGLKADDPAGLIKYLKSRTLSEGDRTKIDAVVKRLGDESFDERQKASAEVVKFGGQAVGVLKLVAKDDNNEPEVVWRAREALRRIEKETSQSEVIAAALRALSTAKDPEVVPALLAFLPLADTPMLVDTMQDTLTANAVADGKANPALVAGLKAERPAVRRLCGVALVEGGAADKKLRVPDAYPKVLAAAKEEKDAATKFALARTLLVTAREKEAVALLLDVMPDMTRGQVWQAEELLVQLAGRDAPKARCLTTRDSKVKAQTAWKEWWDKAAPTTDVAKGELEQRLKGFLVLAMPDNNTGQNGTVTEYGHDDKPRWRIGGLMNPYDTAVAPTGRVWVCEYNKMRLTEHEPGGKQVSSLRIEVDNGGGGKMDTYPWGVQLLPEGGLLVNCRNVVVEFDKTGKELFRHVRPNQMQDVQAACKLKSGQVVILTQQSELKFIDAKGKESADKKAIKVGAVGQMNALTEVAPDRVMFAEQQQIVEYDLTTGKSVWTTKNIGYNPCSPQRLPNGNTIFYDQNNQSVREITADSVTVWTKPLREFDQGFINSYQCRALVR